jgi:hypothetical protein
LEGVNVKVTPKKMTPAFEDAMHDLMLGAYIVQIVDKSVDPYSPASVLVTMLAPEFKNMNSEDQHELCANVLINYIAKHNIQDAVDRIRDTFDAWVEANPGVSREEKDKQEKATIRLMSELVDENYKATKPIFAGRNLKEVMDDYNVDIRVTSINGVAFEGINNK